MKKSHRLRSAAAAFLAAITVFTSLPRVAQAATSTSQIKDEITDLKVENAQIQAQIESVRTQYNANASEIQALVDKKMQSTRKFPCSIPRLSTSTSSCGSTVR